jgi:hypothetical protein
MLIRLFAGAAIVALFAICPAMATDDAGLARLTTCQDSWLVWSKSDPPRLNKFAAQFHAAFVHKGNDAFSTPKAETTIAGLRVVQVYPESVGMGVGFSVIVDASFESTRKTFEKFFGKPLQSCDASDGMHTCELDIAEQRTFAVMAQDDAKSRTLVGCYYYYEK